MDMTRIGAFLAELRKENDLTQEELGESLGVSNKTVSRWETGTYLPPVEMLQRLSERYSVSINEILSLRGLVRSGHHLDECGLSGTVFAAERMHFPFPQIEGYAVECTDTREHLGNALELYYNLLMLQIDCLLPQRRAIADTAQLFTVFYH